jgi:DNA repair photolyase
MMRRGSHLEPKNRFEATHSEPDYEHLEWDVEHLNQPADRRVEYLPDVARTIVAENTSPDIPFQFSVNPYRGCLHGCSYCYARNNHEYLGLNAGIDFETKIFVKHDAPKLFRQFLSKKSWSGTPITFSGVTDCYQPCEREFRLTRGCLEVAAECNQPITIVTKNALVLRDLPVLREMATKNLIHVFLSVTTLDPTLARSMEPCTSIPAARLRAVTVLSEAGVPVGVMMAPIIPGLNDSEIPSILQAAKDAGAGAVGYVLVRLPLTVEPVFREWLEREQPLKASKVEGLIRDARGGKLYQSSWDRRMVGRGAVAEQIGDLFKTFRDRIGFEGLPDFDSSHFHPPPLVDGQLTLF